MSKWSVFRHVFTSAPDDFPGGGGFRTVACAAALRDMVPLVTLEFLVESYNNREGGDASCRQFVPLARGAKAYALTVFTPLADSPDGRTGNFWAETQVVPIDWLEQAGWDAAAAFNALSWLGPQDFGRLPRDLATEPLAPVAPGSIERLARLDELVPSDCLEALLHAVVQQSRGLRPLRLLEAQGKPARHLEEVVMLLPLTVPPTSRRYRDDDQHRCLTLRTRYPIGGMTFSTDITGYPAAAADRLESADGFVIDLAGRLRTASTDDRYGREYAQWLRGVIQEGKWDQLEALYKRAVDYPGASFFANYRSLLEAPSRSRVATAAEIPEPAARASEHTAGSERSGLEAVEEAVVAPPAAVPEEPTVTPVQDRQREWAARDRVEGELWQMRESHKSQIDELVAKIRQDFAADLEKARNRLLEDVGVQRNKLESDLKEVEKEFKKTGRRTQQKGPSAGREPGSVEMRLEKLERDLAQIKNRLKQLGAPGQPSDAADIALEPSVPTGEQEVPEKRSFQNLLALSREWLLARRWIAVAAGIGLVLGLLGAFVSRMGNISPRQFDPVDRRALEVRASLRERLRTGAAAVPLLVSAAQRPDIAHEAQAMTVALALRHGIRIDGKLDCALHQTALRVPVDGDCGDGTFNALVYATENNCCRSFQTDPDKSKLRNCFITSYLRLGPEDAGQACRGEYPWQKGRIWTEQEASRALSLFQTAASAYQGEAGSELGQSLRSLDPAQSPNLYQSLADKTLTREEATRVVELAWASFSGRNASLRDLTVEQLEDLSRFVDQTIQQSAGPRVASDGAP